MQRLLESALVTGASIAHQAAPATAPGHFFTPVVLTGVTNDSDVVREEAFAPLVPILT